MERNIGEHVDLTHLNKQRGSATAPKKSEAQTEASQSQEREVGTQFIFKKITNQNFKAFRRIPVAFA